MASSKGFLKAANSAGFAPGVLRMIALALGKVGFSAWNLRPSMTSKALMTSRPSPSRSLEAFANFSPKSQ